MSYEDGDAFRSFLSELQASPLDLRLLSAEEAAKELFEFIQKNFGAGTECWIYSPEEGVAAGCGPFWRVIWESGPKFWGVNLSQDCQSLWWDEFDLPAQLKQPEVLLNYDKQSTWYASSCYYFDVGFVDDRHNEPPFLGSIWH